MEDCLASKNVYIPLYLTEQEIHFLYSLCSYMEGTAREAGDTGKEQFAHKIVQHIETCLAIVEKRRDVWPRQD